MLRIHMLVTIRLLHKSQPGPESRAPNKGCTRTYRTGGQNAANDQWLVRKESAQAGGRYLTLPTPSARHHRLAAGAASFVSARVVTILSPSG